MLLLICCSGIQTSQNIVVKTTPESPLNNERDILKRFQTITFLRRLIDEIKDPPSLVLEHLDSNLLVESAVKGLQSSKAKHVAKAVLQALAALHDEGIIHTGTLKAIARKAQASYSAA